MARPSKLTEQVRQDLSRVLASGAKPETAARAAGISRRSFYYWLDRARTLREREEAGGRIRPEDRKYLELLDDIETAQAQAEVRAMAAIQRAIANGVWQSAAWWLERTSEDFAPARRPQGRPPGATSSPDRPSTAAPAPPRVRLRSVK